jgi:serine/arginine repetitive matrix protein 1
MAGNFFRGTTSEQDPRWGNSEKKLLEKMTKSGTFSPAYEIKVDVGKVELTLINKWISERLIDLLGFEDDIVINLVINMLTEAVRATAIYIAGVCYFMSPLPSLMCLTSRRHCPQKLDAKKVHMALVGFLEKKTKIFVEELWTLLADAQSNPMGIPSAFLEKKKSEMAKRNESYAAAQGSGRGRGGGGAGAGAERASSRWGAEAGEGSGRRKSRWDDTRPPSKEGKLRIVRELISTVSN